ncbi:MAG: hypothetical protein KatS3mg057_0169 [Herpetosiphonaceae bacterium]|nr:MAG: hypothetical protein KatS3mg057_0169 [Herpetosiphonaceae bacterium]
MAFEDTWGGPTTGGGAGDTGKAGGEGTVGDRDPGNEKAGKDPTGSSTLNLESPEEKGGRPTGDTPRGGIEHNDTDEVAAARDDIGQAIGGAGAGSDLGGTTDLPRAGGTTRAAGEIAGTDREDREPGDSATRHDRGA